MNSLKVPEAGLLLDGPSDADSASPPQAFVLTLSDDIVEDLIQSARNGEDLQLALGNIPTLHFGSHSHRIEPPADDAPYDLYLTKPFESTRKAERLPHTGSLFKKPKTPAPEPKKSSGRVAKEADHKANSAHSGGKSSTPSTLDSDIEALQNGMAAQVAARDRARMVEKLPASRKGQEKMKGKLWPANYNSASKSLPTSPALNNPAASPSLTPTLSASQQAVERKREQRVVLVHELAVRDRTTDHLRDKWTGKEEDFRSTLENMAEFGAESKKWTMRKTCWKELDVWKYDYATREDRQTAIDNAVRQYDRQRLSSSEAEWQRLLPVEERGKGKCLSRLQANLAKGPAQPAPKIKVQRADDSSGSRDDGSSVDGDKAKANGESMSRSNSNPLPPKPKKASAQDAQAKRLLGNSKAKAAAAKPPSTKPRAGGKGGTGGRVLSQAIIENSDSSGDEAAPPPPKPKAAAAPAKPKDTVIVKTRPPHREPAAKGAPQQQPPQPQAPPPTQQQQQQHHHHRQQQQAPAAAPPPPPPVKRAPVKRSREDDDSSSSSGTPLSKRIKPRQPLPLPPPSSKQRALKAVPASRGAGAAASSGLKNKKTSPTKSSPLASSPPTNASELDEETPPAPAKKRKAEAESKPAAAAAAAKRRAVEGVPTEVLTKAHKFKTYYQKYEALHWEIEALDDPPHEKLADLLDMRVRLQTMKNEIYKHYSPDRD